MKEFELRHEIVRITRDTKRFANEMMEPVCHMHGITMQQFHILMELRMEPNQTVSQLSDCVGILPTNFPQVCRKLEHKGLIQRRHSEEDRRSYILSLTEEGNIVVTSVDKDITDKFQALFNSESEETITTIIKGFEALHSFMSRLNAYDSSFT